MGARLDAAIGFRPRLPTDDAYIRALSMGAFSDYAASGARAVQALMRAEGARTEVAVLDDEPVGFFVVSFERSRSRHAIFDRGWVAHLSAIATDPMMVGRGVGRRLLARAESIAVERGAVCLSLTTGVDNLRARALFVGAGYVALAGVASFYGSGKDAVFMHKSLG